MTTVAVTAPATTRPRAARRVRLSTSTKVLLGLLGAPITADVATNLYAALLTDTGGFLHENTNEAALRLGASLVAAGATNRGALSVTLGFIAVVAATINVVGGFMITDRMLKMFKRQEKK